MAFNLPAMARKAGVRRRRVKFRPIKPRPAQVRELEAIYAAALAPWDARAEEIVAAYRLPGRTGFADSADETSRLIDLIVLETSRALIRLTARLRTFGGKAERVHREAWRDGVLAATSIDLNTVLSPLDVAETVEATVQRNVAMITKISDNTRAKIADIVFRGVQGRTPTVRVAAEIREAVDFERKRAKRVAADQTTKLSAALDKARQLEAGLDHFIWRHSRKKHPRKTHQARDGELFKWEASAPDPGADPPDAGDGPGEPPYCGCTAQAVMLRADGTAF